MNGLKMEVNQWNVGAPSAKVSSDNSKAATKNNAHDLSNFLLGIRTVKGSNDKEPQIQQQKAQIQPQLSTDGLSSATGRVTSINESIQNIPQEN